MTPNEEKPRPRRWVQCPAMFGKRGRYRFCVKREGHEGDHRGDRAQWDETGRKPITELLPR